jgi:hypothetical protein
MRGTACIGTDWEIVSRIGASRRFLVVYSTHRAAYATPLVLAACATPLRLAACAVPLTLADWAIAF